MDVASFLAGHRPFDDLDEADLARTVASVQIEHFAPGVVILEQAGAPSRFLYVVRKGAVEIVDDGRVIDLAGEGEVFGMWSLLGDVAPSSTVRTAEDTLCYLIDADVATAVLGSSSGKELVADTYRRRIRRYEEALRTEGDPGRYRSVGSLVQRPPVTCDPQTRVTDAAAEMARQRVSSLLVPSPDGRIGILTDRDLRTRVVAEGLSGETPVGEVMTPDATTVPADTMAGEVLLRMLGGGFHHFPIVDADGTLLGVVTDTDLMDVGRRTPFALKSAIERAPDRAEVVAAVRDLPSVVTTLVGASADPVDVGHVVAFVIDAATTRLLGLGTEELGEAPGRWTWLALGSAARHEQALHTDQDHAMALEGPPEMEPYAARLAELVTSGLEEAGIPRCRGNAMATHPTLRRDVPGFIAQFRTWMGDVSPEGSERLSIVFDYRKVTGTVGIEEALDEIVRRAPADVSFVRHLRRRALDLRPPTGFLRDFVVEAHGEHAGRLDVKRGGILIIGNLARGWAIGAGLTATRTLDRLAAAQGAGAIDAETRDGLAEAFRFLWEVRLRHQVEQHAAGLEPDDFIDPRALGAVTRQGLKEAFRIIARAQKGLATELGVSMR